MSNHDQHPMVMPPSATPLLSPHPSMSYDSEMLMENPLREYLHILVKRKWLIIGTCLTIVLLVGIYNFFQTRIYRANAMLQITQDNPAAQVSVEDKLSRLTDADSLEKFQTTQYKILKSRSLAQRVIQALNLQEAPEFKAIREANPDKNENEILNTMAEALLAGLAVTPVRNTFLVEVAYHSPDKALARDVVNAIADEYMYLSIDRRNESFSLVRKWLDKQLQGMAAKVQEAQKRLYKFGQKSDIYTMEDKDNVIIQKFIDLNGLLTKAQAEVVAKKSQYNQIKEKGPGAPLIVNNPSIASLRQQLAAQRSKVSALRKVYRDDHPELKAEQANLSELNNLLKAEVKRQQESISADYEAASRTEKLLSESLTAQKHEMIRLQDNLSDYQILKRDAQTNEHLYQALLARVKEASIASTMVPSNVAVIDPAQLPGRPYKPETSRDLALALVIGMTFAIGLALLLEHLDDSIKSVSEAERAFNIPSLGILPLLGASSAITLRRPRKTDSSKFGGYLPRLQRSSKSSKAESEDIDLISSKHPQSQFTEAIRQIYTSIRFSAAGVPPCAIMVTSPNPSEGKSLMVVNLAQVYALDGKQVVLLDCDLRKPRLHKALGVNILPGLSNYLTGSATLEEILQPTAIPNLSIITAGARPPNPPKLLNTDIFKDLLMKLRGRFSNILIDTPPVMGFADARFVSAITDGIVLVAKYHSTQKRSGQITYQLLSHAPLLGCVLNSVGVHGRLYGGYYYNYYYKTYNKYYGKKEE